MDTTLVPPIGLEGSPLTESDYASLARSWIDRESADKSFLRRVTSVDGQAIIGASGSQDCAGILFPYIAPGENRVREVRLRRDNPEMERQGDKLKEVRKYLSPPGRGNKLYFPPGTDPAWLKDTDLPIVITEGEKKTLALNRLAWHELSEASETPRFLAIGLSGVWNWKGVVGKETGANGARRDVKGPIPDLGLLDWSSREVSILFDANVKTNDSVKAARTDLARHLKHELGAEVYYADLPQQEGINGIDDFIAASGPEKALKLLSKHKKANVKNKANTQAVILGEMYEGVDFFHARDLTGYATFLVNGHRETWPVRSKAFRNFLNHRFYEQEGKPVASQTLQDFLATCEAKAQFDGDLREVGLRVLHSGGGLYLDLSNEEWQAVEVTRTGWRLTADPPERFRRSRSMTALPTPVSGGAIEELFPFINAGDRKNWILLVSWLIGTFSQSGPYPILILQGEQGSAKSTTARVLRSLIDPSTPSLRSVPRDERDLMIAANNSLVLSLDNLSGTSQWISDALCRLATGGGFATRELHTDQEEVLFDATRPIILNGIDDIATNPDLADRALVVTLPQISEQKRQSEREFWRLFEMARPRILGALLDAASAALANLERVNVAHLPRMADFAKWVCAATSKLPFTQEDFLGVYGQNRRESIAVSIEASPFASAILELLKKDYGEWEGSATELLVQLKPFAAEETLRSKDWPKDARKAGNKVTRVAPLLRAFGVDVSREQRGHDNRRVIIFRRKEAQIDVRIARTDENANKSTSLNEMDASNELEDDCSRDARIARNQVGLERTTDECGERYASNNDVRAQGIDFTGHSEVASNANITLPLISTSEFETRRDSRE